MTKSDPPGDQPATGGDRREQIGKSPPRRIYVPTSARTGIHWPAVPSAQDALVLALLYQLEQSQWLPPDTLHRLQFRQLGLLLDHAAATVPFYADRLGEAAGLAPGDLTWEHWRQIPILERADVQEAGADLFTTKLPGDHGKTYDIATSGSTGRPIAVKGTDLTGLYHGALNLRFQFWCRRDFSAKSAAIRALDGWREQAARQNKPVPWVQAHRSGPRYFFDITRPVAEQFEWLRKLDPDYLLTHPSNLGALLQRSEDTGYRPSRLRDAGTTGEVVDPALRRECERVWGIPIKDSYTAEEVGMIALQCPEHAHYHVQAERLLVEILDAAGAACKPGEVGRIVVTDLHNFAAPLIRYAIGDYAEVGAPCPCGRGLPVLSRILGRSRNMLVLPSGDSLWPTLDLDILQAVAPFRSAQVIQRSVEEIEVRLVATRPMTAEEEERMRVHFRDRLTDAFRLNFVYVDDIPRSPNGKFEDFRSEVDGGG